jgi:hypothetical protein
MALLAAGAVLSGCGPTKITTEASPALQQHQVKTIVVMPFGRLQTPQIIHTLAPEFSVPRGAKRSDISVVVAPPSPDKLDKDTAVVPESAPEKITDMVYRYLSKREGLRVLSPTEAVVAMKAVERTTPVASPEELARQVAFKTGSDAALIGNVLIYEERVGSKWGATPAVVGFEVKLIGADGLALWTANYYERQRPLVEDVVGFIQHGGVFLTAAELAEYGAEQMARRFPFGSS